MVTWVLIAGSGFVVLWLLVSQWLADWEYRKMMSVKNREKYIHVLQDEYGVSAGKLEQLSTERLYEAIAVMKSIRN